MNITFNFNATKHNRDIDPLIQANKTLHEYDTNISSKTHNNNHYPIIYNNNLIYPQYLYNFQLNNASILSYRGIIKHTMTTRIINVWKQHAFSPCSNCHRFYVIHSYYLIFSAMLMHTPSTLYRQHWLLDIIPSDCSCISLQAYYNSLSYFYNHNFKISPSTA